MIIFEPNNQSPVDFANLDMGKINDFLETQKKIVTSRKVISRVFNALNLADTVKKTDSSGLFGFLKLSDITGIFRQTEIAEIEPDPVEIFRKSISVESLRNTNLLEIKVVSSDPKKAALYTNTLSELYIEYDLEDRRASSNNAFTWLSEQVAILKAKVKQSEMDVLKYKQEEELSSLEKRQSTVDDKITELNDTYSKLLLQRMEKEAILREIKKLGKKLRRGDNIPGLQENEQLKLLKKEYTKIEIELAKVSTKYKKNHPERVRLKSQLSLVAKTISKEAKKIISDLEIETRIFRDREDNIQNALQAQKKLARRIAEQAIQYGVLKREAESNKQMYNVLLERLKETDIGGSIVANNIRIVDESQVPRYPYKPNIPRNLLLAAVLGLFLGTGACFLIEYFDNTFKNENDVETFLDLPLVGAVSNKEAKISVGGKLEGLLSRGYQESKSMLEHYRTEHILNSLLITSSVAGEGKTTSSASIAMAFARSGTKTLLIDADIFKPALSKMFSFGDKHGLSDYLLKNEDPAGLIQKTEMDNLYMLPAGLVPPNPEELFASDSMKELAVNITKDFDLVIFDSPPLAATLGVAILGSVVDGTTLVVKSHATSHSIASRTVATFRKLKVNTVGVILTRTKKSGRYGYGYGYGYGDGYGYGSDEYKKLDASSPQLPDEKA